MSSTFGENLKLSIFGQSHGAAVGMVLDGIPAGYPVDEEKLRGFLARRAPGQGNWTTPRKESDTARFLGGILDGFTCGAPIAAMIENTNTRSGDYEELKTCPRPGHADFTAQIKYGGFQDSAGGGHFSGRLTAPLCVAGGLCLQWLEEAGIRVGAQILRIGSVTGEALDPVEPDLACIGKDFPALSAADASAFMAQIEAARQSGDSVDGTVLCAVTGLPAGIGEPMFGGVESTLAQILFGIPGVKGVRFGDTQQRGRDNNDAYRLINGKTVTRTNHCGGILGGITNGMPLVFTVDIKPTPSIAAAQETLDLASGKEIALRVKGRHDPCIVPRAVPVVEAAAALAIFDLMLGNTQTVRRK